jgi:DNA-binding protein HU-beta
MKKTTLVDIIAEKTGIPKVDIMLTINTLFSEMKNAVADGEQLIIRHFGTFGVKKRAAKTGRDIRKNVGVHIPEHFIPNFKPADEFVELIRDNYIPKGDKNENKINKISE